MVKFKVAIAGENLDGLKLLRFFKGFSWLSVTHGNEFSEKASDSPDLDLVIDTADLKMLSNEEESFKKKNPPVLEGRTANFMLELVREYERLQNSKNSSRIGKISGSKFSFHDLVGSSKQFQNTVEVGKKAARCDAAVLISGESGTGKEIYAHSIHSAGSRSSKPFVKIDCSCIPENLIEHELFGCEKGTLPGSSRLKPGKIELAHEGTLLLNEVGELSPYLQAKMVRFLQDGEFERVGGSQVYQADVRVITTSTRSLKDAVREGMFREDLYFKLSVIELKIPPLRVRNEDIKELARHFVDKFSEKLGKKVEGISPEALQLLEEYEWPGNVREVENVLERALVNMEDDVLNTWHLAPFIGQYGSLGCNKSMEVMPLDKMEQILLNAALTRYGDTLEGKKKAAQALNISLATLYNKLRKYKASGS